VGCSAPVAAHAQSAISDQQSAISSQPPAISLTGLVASIDGQHVIRVNGMDSDPAALGNELAQQALAQGAQELLA
jgi:porphobilinogen deaminase